MYSLLTRNTVNETKLFPIIEHFIQDNKWPIVFLIGISLLSYGYELFNFNISIDAELIGVETDQWYWISIGRWGMYLINSTLMLHTTIPVAPLAVSLIFIIISTVAIFKLFDSTHGYASYIFSALVISFPTLPHMLMFSTSAAGIGIGMLSATIGIYFYLSAIKIHKIYSILFFTFAIGVYQTFILFIAAIMMMLSLHEFVHTINISHDNPYYLLTQKIAHHLAFLILVCIVYLIISKIFMILRNVEPLYSQFINLELLFADTYMVLKNSLYYIYAAYSGHNKIYTDNLPLIAILNGLSLWSLLKIKTQNYTYTFIKLLSLGTCLSIPFAFNLLNNGIVAIRTLLALPFVSTIFWWMGYNYGSKLIKQMIIITGTLLIIQFAIINNWNFNANGIVLDHNKAIAVNLILEIDKTISINANHLPCIEFVGYKTFPANEFFTQHEVFGASFFEWAYTAPEHVWRIYRFLKLMGLNKKLQICSIEKSHSVINFLRKIPSWPKDGAIKIVNDILIVKLSD